jgi:pSer/pThr/pTyr-binding forkhead associated (FHA) protein
MVSKLIGRTGSVSGRDFVLDDTAMVTSLGAGRARDICVPAPGVGRDHARIVRRDGGYWLEDAGSKNGTFVNGQRVTAERLRHLDVITLGRYVDLVFVESGTDADAPDHQTVLAASLEFVDGPRAGTGSDLAEGETVLGRAPSCTIVFDHPSVGKRHARVMRTKSQVALEDLGARNGTFVNDSRIHVAVLKNGDHISLGGVRTMRVRIDIDFSAGPPALPAESEVPDTESLPPTDPTWMTKFVWSPHERAAIAANQAEVIDWMEPAAARKPSKQRKPVATMPKDGTGATQGFPGRITSHGSMHANPPPTVPSPQAAAASPAATAPGVRLRGIEVVVADQRLRFGIGTFTIGRGPEADIRLDESDREVSRNHARITVQSNQVRLHDQGQNGTFVNEERLPVHGHGRLQDGDVVRCGAAKLTVHFLR